MWPRDLPIAENDIPVVLYDKWERYNHLNASVVKKDVPDDIDSAYYITKKDILSKSLDWILETHSKRKVPDNKKEKYVYLKDYSEDFYDFAQKSILL